MQIFAFIYTSRGALLSKPIQQCLHECFCQSSIKLCIRQENVSLLLMRISRLTNLLKVTVVVPFKELLFFRIEPGPAHTSALLYPPCPRYNFSAIIRLETLATQARFPTWYCFGCTRQAVRPILCKQMQTTLNCNVIGKTFRLHPPRCVTPWGTPLRK